MELFIFVVGAAIGAGSVIGYQHLQSNPKVVVLEAQAKAYEARLVALEQKAVAAVKAL